MKNIPVVANGRSTRYLTPSNYKKVSFLERYTRLIDELLLATLIIIVTWMLVIATIN